MFRLILRSISINLASVYIAIKILSGIMTYIGGFQTLLMAAGVIALINLFVKPVINLLLLPINLITFGLLSWIVNVGILYILVSFVSYVNIQPLQFAGFSYHGISVSAFSLNALFRRLATFPPGYHRFNRA